MKKILTIIMIISCLMFNVYSADQQVVADYEFEENGGNIILDSSGHNNHLVVNGLSWTTDNVNGAFAVDFDGSNDYAQGTLIYEQLGLITMSVWFKTFSDSKDDIFVVYTGDSNLLLKLELDANAGSNNLRVVYTDSFGTEQYQDLEADNFVRSVYYHVTFSYDFFTDELKYYRNGVLTDTFQNVNIRTPIETIVFRLGTSEVITSNQLDGRLDSLKVMNFVVNQSQVTELYTTNTITLIVEEEEEEEEEDGDTILNVTGFVQSGIINSYSPFENQTFSSSDNILINLNIPATCDFYIDSNLVNSGENQISYAWEHSLDYGNYTGSFYCYYDSNEIRYYDYTEQFDFSVVASNDSQINFFITGLDYDVANENLYITTPCLKHSVSVGDITDGVDNSLNEGKSVYIQNVVNGKAEFILDENTHEFCLINGNIQYNANTFTTDFNINKIDGVLDLGNFNLPSNVTESYSIQTELLEIYDNYDPKAWGQTWSGIIGAFILLIFGAGVVFVGTKADNGKIVIAGVLLVMSAFGVGLTSFVGLIL